MSVDSGFSYVGMQSNVTDAKGNIVDNGWYAQQYIDGRLTWLGAVHEPIVGALLNVAVLLDPRIKHKKPATAWLMHMCHHPESIPRWLKEVDLTQTVKIKSHATGRGKTENGNHAKVRMAALDGTLRHAKMSADVPLPAPSVDTGKGVGVADLPYAAANIWVPPGGQYAIAEHDQQHLIAEQLMEDGAEAALTEGFVKEYDVDIGYNNGENAVQLVAKGATYEQLIKYFDLTEIAAALPASLLLSRACRLVNS